MHTTSARNTILWLHGFPFTSAIFAKQLAIQGFDHVMPDLPARDSMEEYAKVAIEQLDERGIAKATFAPLDARLHLLCRAAPLSRARVGLILIDTRETADTDEQRKQRFEMIEKAKREGTGPIVEVMLTKMLTADAPDDMRE